MTYFQPGMPPDLHRANLEYEDMMRRTRNNPTRLVSFLGVALKYASEYFTAKTNASTKAIQLITHLDRCDICRGTGWESCDQMKAHFSEGKSFTTMTLG